MRFGVVVTTASESEDATSVGRIDHSLGIAACVGRIGHRYAVGVLGARASIGQFGQLTVDARVLLNSELWLFC